MDAKIDIIKIFQSLDGIVYRIIVTTVFYLKYRFLFILKKYDKRIYSTYQQSYLYEMYLLVNFLYGTYPSILDMLSNEKNKSGVHIVGSTLSRLPVRWSFWSDVPWEFYVCVINDARWWKICGVERT